MTLPELLYYFGYLLKKRYSLSHQRRLTRKVISVGNITLGGTGKTPAAIAIAEEAKRRGFSPVILTRGYRGEAKGPCFVSKGYGPVLSVEDAGDEPVLMSMRLKDVPVIKSPDRYLGGLFALSSLEPQPDRPYIFILDDGFQHWSLYRDRDVVLIDGLNPFGSGRLFPLGPLREPLRELVRADLFVVTKARRDDLAGQLKAHNRTAAVYFSDYRVSGVRDGQGSSLSPEILRDKKVFAFCGIANPESFRRTLTSLCREIGVFKTYRDHHRYTEADVRDLEGGFRRARGDVMVTTEKDMVKLTKLGLSEKLLCVEISFAVDGSFYDDLFSQL